MFNFFFFLVSELNSKLQIIVTDHAYFDDENFISCIIEQWRNGKKLIPDSWIK
ncbi:MAG TPA: hypothetical protein DDY71_00050 [Spirochaetia bacterium]|nr:hypothetical protein [Spirochaetia bacterium]